jgi:hypothetical protein
VNDGQWHYVVGTVDAAGMQLFVDGARVGRDQTVRNPKSYTGYWRIGADQTSGFTNRPSDTTLTGTIDEVAVYPKALTKAEIQAHYTASGRIGLRYRPTLTARKWPVTRRTCIGALASPLGLRWTPPQVGPPVS